MVGKIFRQSEGIAMALTQGHRLQMVRAGETMVNTNVQRETVRRLIEIQEGVSIYRRSEKASNCRRAIGEFKAEIYGPLQLKRSAEEDGPGAHSLTWTFSFPEAWFMSECTTRGTPSGFRWSAFQHYQAMWTRNKYTPA